MSQAPYAVRNIRFGTKFGVDLKVGRSDLWTLDINVHHHNYNDLVSNLPSSAYQLEDTLWAGLTDLHIKTPMGITAENLAEKYQITREDCDNYAHQTQQRWKAGKADPVFWYLFMVCLLIHPHTQLLF